MTSSLKKVTYRRNHPERAQPAARQRLGLLEKKKDYQQRARDFNAKKSTLKKLRDKAYFKNPDEFYYGMVNAKLKNGVHAETKARTQQYTADTLRVLKTQDAMYVKTMLDRNQKKIERLRGELQSAPPPPPAEGDNKAAAAKPKHVHFRRGTGDKLVAKPAAPTAPAAAATPRVRVQKRKLQELEARQARAQALRTVEQELAVQRHMFGKGSKRAVGTDAVGNKVFKWAQERKK